MGERCQCRDSFLSATRQGSEQGGATSAVPATCWPLGHCALCARHAQQVAAIMAAMA